VSQTGSILFFIIYREIFVNVLTRNESLILIIKQYKLLLLNLASVNEL